MGKTTIIFKKFENKIGTIIERMKCSSGIYSYRIEFEQQNNYGYFYKEDFILMNEDPCK